MLNRAFRAIHGPPTPENLPSLGGLYVLPRSLGLQATIEREI